MDEGFKPKLKQPTEEELSQFVGRSAVSPSGVTAEVLAIQNMSHGVMIRIREEGKERLISPNKLSEYAIEGGDQAEEVTKRREIEAARTRLREFMDSHKDAVTKYLRAHQLEKKLQAGGTAKPSATFLFVKSRLKPEEVWKNGFSLGEKGKISLAVDPEEAVNLEGEPGEEEFYYVIDSLFLFQNIEQVEIPANNSVVEFSLAMPANFVQFGFSYKSPNKPVARVHFRPKINKSES